MLTTSRRIRWSSTMTRQASTRLRIAISTRREAAVVTEKDGRIVTVGFLDQGADAEGFCVEPISESGNNNKVLSKCYQIVDLRNMRRFSCWQELMKGTNVNDLRECRPTV